MTIAKILPLAFVMIAGPQILTAIFLATSEEWRQNSAAYVAGAALSITATITASYFLSTGATGQGSSDDTLYIVVIVLLVFAAIHTFSPGRPPNRRNGWAAIPNTRMISCVVFMAARCYAPFVKNPLGSITSERDQEIGPLRQPFWSRRDRKRGDERVAPSP